MLMGIVIWAVAGLIVGFAAGKVAKQGNDDPGLGIAAGVTGGVAGGLLVYMASSSASGEFNVWSVAAAVAGAAVAVAGWHAVRGYASRA